MLMEGLGPAFRLASRLSALPSLGTPILPMYTHDSIDFYFTNTPGSTGVYRASVLRKIVSSLGDERQHHEMPYTYDLVGVVHTLAQPVPESWDNADRTTRAAPNPSAWFHAARSMATGLGRTR